MSYFRLTVKNYRCFTDESPLVIEFNEGHVAGCLRRPADSRRIFGNDQINED